MRAFVFTDEALAGQAGRFVWLDLDMEKAANAPFRKRLSHVAYPTYYIVDPRDERVALKWVGGLTVPQMLRFLDDARLAVERRGETPGGSPADVALARADAHYAAGEDSAAAVAYQEAVEAAPAGWSRYSRAVESFLFAASRAGRDADVATMARDALPRLGRTVSAASAAASGLDAASGLPADDPRRAGLLGVLVPAAHAILADTAIVMAADDRSGLFISVGGALETLGDSAGVKRNDEAWAAFLEGQAARAATPEERAVLDPHRLSAYLELGRPELAVPMLEASERALPGDYNPPARLAVAYRALRRWDEGLKASDRAMALAYGPRKLNLYQVRIDLYLGRGDRDGARRTVEEALDFAGKLPAGQRSEATLAALRKRLETLKS